MADPQRQFARRPGRRLRWWLMFVAAMLPLLARADAAIGVALAAADPAPVGNGEWRVAFWVIVQNVGDIPLDHVQIKHSLATDLAPARLRGVTDFSASGELQGFNGGFDGDRQQYVLNGRESLAVGATAVLDYVATIDPGGFDGVLETRVRAFGTNPHTGEAVSDCSIDGKDPDPASTGTDAADNGGANHFCGPTPILLPPQPTPRLGLSKWASPSVLVAPGTFRTTLVFGLENFSAARLAELRLEDDLRDAFPAPAQFAVRELSSNNLRINPGYNGASDTDLLATGNSLAAFDRQDVTLVVDFEPATLASPLFNQADARSARAPPDRSTDGLDPDPNDDQHPDEAEPTKIMFSARDARPGQLGLAKSASAATPPNGVGGLPLRTRLRFTLANVGGQALDDLSIRDDLRETFARAASFRVVPDSLRSDSLNINSGFDGRRDLELLAPGNWLSGGDRAVVEVDVEFDPGTARSPFLNSAEASAPHSPSDRSTNGDEPDPNGDGHPDEAHPTPIPFERPTGRIGVAKSATPGVASPHPDFEFRTQLRLTLENLGTRALHDLRLIDRLRQTFEGAENFQVVAGSLRSDQLPVAADYDGRNNVDLLAPGNGLDAGARAVVELAVDFSPGSVPSPFLNRAIARVQGSPNDASTNGDDPDPNGDGIPDESSPTPIPFERPTPSPGRLGLAKSATEGAPDGAGEFVTTLVFTLENLGETAIDDVRLTDDLALTFSRAAAFRVVSGSLSSASLPINPAFDGADDTDLLAPGARLAARASARVSVDVAFDPGAANSPFLNSATAQAPGVASDVSTDGDEPDPNGDGQPDEALPTPIPFVRPPPQPAELTLIKTARTPNASVGGRAAFRLTIGNPGATPLGDVRVADAPPSGFRLLPDSVVLRRAGSDNLLGSADDVRTALGVTPRSPNRFDPFALAVGERVAIDYQTQVAATVLPGSYTNTATASAAGLQRSARARVTVGSDTLFSEATVLGKVFNDVNGDGRQQPGEPGVAGVRLITVEGLLIETDRFGRYHVAGLDAQALRGNHFVVKLDANSLPANSRTLTDPRQVVRLTPGMPARVNFPVLINCCERSTTDPFRVEKRLDVRLQAFEPGRRGAAARATFDVRSNFFNAAPDYALIVFRERDSERQRPLARACFSLDERNFGQQRISLNFPTVRGERLAYVLQAFNQPVCQGRTGQTPLVRDETEPQRFDARRFQAPALLAERAWGNALAVDRITVTGVGQLWAQRTASEKPACWTIASRRSGWAKRWASAFYRAPPAAQQRPPVALEKRSCHARCRQAHARNCATRRQRATVAELQIETASPLTAIGADPNGIRIVTEGLRTTLDCCGVITSIEPVLDRNNDVSAIKVRNLGEHALRLQTTWLGTNASTPAITLAAGSRHEFFTGSLGPRGTRSGANWEQLLLTLDQASYVINRRSVGEDGRFHPPELVVTCQDIDVTPRHTEDGRIISHRIAAPAEPAPAGDEVLSGAGAPDNAQFGVALVDLTVGGYSASGTQAEAFERIGKPSFADGRLALYWRGVRGGDLTWVAHVDTRYADLDDLGDRLRATDARRVFRQLDPDRYYPTYGDDATVRADSQSQGAIYARIDWRGSRALWGNYQTGLTDTQFAHYNRSLYGAYLRVQSDTALASDTELLNGAGSAADEPRLRATAFFADSDSAAASDVFRATGGSLYYLRHPDIVEGSDKVWVEVRRRDSQQVLDREILIHGQDYELDPLQGRVLLTRPLHQVAAARRDAIVRDTPLTGDEVFLLIDYEYVPNAFAGDAMTAGGRLSAALGRRLRLGATAVTDERAGTDYRLLGADLTWRPAPRAYIALEAAESRAQQTRSAFSADGGLTFSATQGFSAAGDIDGAAYGLEARFSGTANATDGARFTEFWWKRRESGFDSGRGERGLGLTDAGIEFAGARLGGVRVDGGATLFDRRGEDRERSAWLQAERFFGPADCAETNQRGCTRAGLEARYDDVRYRDPAAARRADLTGARPEGESLLLGARLSRATGERTTVYASGQLPVWEQTDTPDNRLLSLGLRRQVNAERAWHLEAASGDRGHALQGGFDLSRGGNTVFNIDTGIGRGAVSRFGARHVLPGGHELYGSFAVNPDRTEGARQVATLGQRRQLGDRARVFTESQFGRQRGGASTAHVFGLELERFQHWTFGTTLEASELDTGGGAFERLAASVGAVYANTQTRFSSRIEFREDTRQEAGRSLATRQYLTSTALLHKLAEHSRLSARLNLGITDDAGSNDALGRFAEFDVGYAYRPVTHDRLQLLARYSYLHDVATFGQLLRPEHPGDERAHVVSADALWELSGRWHLGARFALKRGDFRLEKGQGDWLELNQRLSGVRLNYQLPRVLNDDAPSGRRWWNGVELIAEYRWLRDLAEDSTRDGALFGVYRRFGANYRLGAGYNFSDFSDDLRRQGYRAHGWFVDLTAVY